jgi:uncharacterized RDD family membrane protein YckC
MFYEAFLLIGVLSLAFILPHLLLGLVLKATIPGILLWSHVFVVLLAYFAWLWKRNGQTLAMQTWKIKLVAADRKTPSLFPGLAKPAAVRPRHLLGACRSRPAIPA